MKPPPDEAEPPRGSAQVPSNGRGDTSSEPPPEAEQDPRPTARDESVGMPALESRSPSDERRFLDSSLIESYWPSERRAMLVHRFFLSTRLQRQASIEETLTSWEGGSGRDWRHRKMVRDSQRQIREIERHKYFLSQRRGEDIGWEAAAADWVQHHARRWREWWEEQAESCP